MDASTHPSDEARVEAILTEWFERQLTGQEPAIEELCADAPHLVARVREMLERQEALLGRGPGPATRRPPPIDRLGGYELKARIGSGGMGDVYLAREVALDRIVAIKVLRRELADDPVRQLRFKREAQLTAALDHPNIVPVYGTGEDQGFVFLVMKHLPGTTLDRVPGTWEPRRIAAIGAQVARALHAAHEVHIVHRDIKPGNVQVDGDHAWVLDFGLARGRLDLTLTTDWQAPGTLAYMPPEQLRGDHNTLDPRGDVYSLGATLYRCVAGRPPFDADSPEALVRRALLHDPAPLELGPGEHDFGTIVCRALEKDPVRRFPTALELAEDLERFAAGEPIRSRPPSTFTRAIKLARRHRVVVAAAAAALLVALVLVPKMWRDAADREAELTRLFEVVSKDFLGAGLPAMALSRLRELESSAAALADPRHATLVRAAQATLVRDAMLDRIQLDTVYRQTLLGDEFAPALRDLREEARDTPLTLVALAFLAREHGDRERLSRLTHELGATGACQRLVAGLLAELSGRDVAEAITGIAAGSRAVEDHVFTAVLLRIADAPGRSVDAEIATALAVGPEHPRARMMLGVRHWIRRDTRRAGEVFGLLLDAERPRAELHIMIAQIANYLGDPAQAAHQLDLAEAALAAVGRPPNRWLAMTRITQATLAGRHEAAAELLDGARRQFGDDEWLGFCAANLHLARGEEESAHALLTRLAREAEVPWNRRRARSAILQIDVREVGDAPGAERVRHLLDQAEALIAEAETVNDSAVLIQALMERSELAFALYDAYRASGRFDEARPWEERFWDSLVRVLALDDLHEAATYDAARYVVRRIRAQGDGTADPLALGDRAAPMRRRAITLVRRGHAGEQRVEYLVELATFATRLSAAVGDRRAALETGAIAAPLVGALPVDDERTGDLVMLLDESLKLLGRDAWPAPEGR